MDSYNSSILSPFTSFSVSELLTLILSTDATCIFCKCKRVFIIKKNDFKNSLMLEVNSQDHSLLKYLIRYLNWRHWINYSAFNIQSDHTSYPKPYLFFQPKIMAQKYIDFFAIKKSKVIFQSKRK